MTKDEKILVAFWKIFREADEEDIFTQNHWNGTDKSIRVFAKGERDREIAIVKVRWEKQLQRVFFGLLPSRSVRKEYLYITVRDRTAGFYHYGRIYDEVEIQKVKNIILREEEQKKLEREAREHESLNSLL